MNTEQMPAAALWLAYWLHMLATVAWIGGLASLALVVIPAARQSLKPDGYAAFLGAVQRRFDPLAWFSLALLAGTGMFQMSAHPNYQGFLAVESRWAWAILVKHIFFFGMALLSAYLTWGLLPRLRRLALRQAHGDWSETENAALRQQERRLLQLNLVLGLFILALTAIARTS